MNRDKMLTARQLVSKAFEELKPNGFKFKVMGGTYDCSKGTIRIEVYEVDETRPKERIEMKKTINERMLSFLERLKERIRQLDNNIETYKNSNNFEEAMKSSIKRDQLKMLEGVLRKELFADYMEIFNTKK